MKKIYNKDKPHADIGKQKFRVKRYYTAWVEYDVVADSKEEAENAITEQGGIEEIKWAEGYHKDDPVGFFISIPEMNQIFKYVNGKFGIFGKIKTFYQ